MSRRSSSYFGGGAVAPFGLNSIVSTGQSLSVGGGTASVVTTTQPYNNLKLFDSAGTYDITTPNAGTLSLVAAVAPMRPLSVLTTYPTNILGEEASIATCNQITALARSAGYADYVLAATSVGLGGALYNNIKKGGASNAYAASIYEVTAIKRLATALGLTYGVAAILLTHGEADSTSGTYAANVQTLWTDYNADISALTSQGNGTLPMFATQQPSSPNTTALPTSSLQLLAASVSNPLIVMVGPKYQYGNPTMIAGQHLTPPALYQQMDEVYGHAFWVWKTQAASIALTPASYNVNSNVVTVTFNVYQGPLVFDTGPTPPHQSTNMQWAAGKGFEAKDDGGNLTIDSVAIAGNTVVITLHTVPTTGLTISYACTPDVAAFNIGFPDGRCGLLHDSDTFTGYVTGVAHPNWCVQFQKTGLT